MTHISPSSLLIAAFFLAGCESATAPDDAQAAPEEGPRLSVLPAPLVLRAAVAGSVTDLTGDGLGDTHNPLPGPAPLLSAPGFNPFDGLRRFQMEFALPDLTPQSVARATVRVHWRLGTVDELDTHFYELLADGNGTLDAEDFQTPARRVPGVVLPIPESPPGTRAPVGTEGSFSFDATAQVQAALEQGFSYLSLQSRMPDEGLPFPGHDLRGVLTRTTATSNLQSGLEPTVVVELARIVSVDVKPGDTANVVPCQNERAVIPTALLTDEAFDAGSVDVASLTVSGAMEMHRDRSGGPRAHWEDVDGDGDTDLLVHVRLRETNLSCGDTRVMVEGRDEDGVHFSGSDRIMLVSRR